MTASFLVTLREGLEAAIIVGIILTFLARTDNRHRFRDVWMGVGAAIAVSLAVGAALFWTTGELSGRGEQIFEGIAMFTAVIVLSYMIVWMKKQSANIKGNLESKVKSALLKGSATAIISLVFVVVVREGIETALFMFGTVESATPLTAAVGGLLGLAVAAVIGYTGYKGAKWLNLSIFFNVTGSLLIVFAAGLLAYGIHEFQEAGLIPSVIEHVWDINHILDEKTGVGSFLKALFGYNGNPSLVELVFYFGYLIIAFLGFYLTGRKPKEEIKAEVV